MRCGKGRMGLLQRIKRMKGRKMFVQVRKFVQCRGGSVLARGIAKENAAQCNGQNDSPKMTSQQEVPSHLYFCFLGFLP